MPAFQDALKSSRPLLLPVAHDALTAKLIERAGFKAYQIGGFAVIGARYGLPDIDLTHFSDKVELVESIFKACSLPVMVDCDDGYGDAKNVTQTVQSFADRGVDAVFIEDQQAPKRCGHMTGKRVIPVEMMEQKVRAAVTAKAGTPLFFVARTDARGPSGVDDAIARAKRYRDAGADGVYVEGLKSEQELEKVGRALRDVPLATTILERGGETPFLPPEAMAALGFAMVLYPTTVMFRVVSAIEQALMGLIAGEALDPANSIDMDRYMKIVDMPFWQKIESQFPMD
jgi:2-methylisocitrate lyase-like PEP mutase family enzyme